MTTPAAAMIDARALRDHVRDMYRDLGCGPPASFTSRPDGRWPNGLVIPPAWLDAVPAETLASFAGVGHMLDLAAIQPGETVLDLGSGAGTDAFIAAHLAGPAGRVIGVDMTDAQLAKARRLRDERGLRLLRPQFHWMSCGI